jgi:undecaprenyl-diphosphatase
MMTIVGGMMVGLRPRQAAEFSFLLGLPTLGGACVYKGAKNLMGEEANMFEVLGPAPIIVGLAVATISAALAVRWLVAFLTRHGVAAFGWYRIAFTALLAMLLWQGVITFPENEAADVATPPAVQSESSSARSE